MQCLVKGQLTKLLKETTNGTIVEIAYTGEKLFYKSAVYWE